MIKHTPGPWHVANGIQIRSARHQIAKVWMMRNGEGNANAKLIAAAPDLLEFAKEWLDRQGSDENYMTAKARAAIAKVTGETA